MWEYFAYHVRESLAPLMPRDSRGESKHCGDSNNLCMLTFLKHWVSWNTFHPERPTGAEAKRWLV